VHEYKRLENNLVQKIGRGFKTLGKGIVSFFVAIGQFFTRRYTVVLVPHSEKKVYNLHISILAVCCFFLVAAGIIGALFWCGASYSSTQGVLAAKDTRLKNTQASLDQLRDQISDLLKAAKNFEPALAGTLSALGADVKNTDGATTASTGDLASIFDIRETPEGVLQEVQDVKQLSQYLTSAAAPVRQIGSLLDSQSALLTEIPSIWPIKGGIGHISMYFGQNINPFSGLYYIHKGIDISTYRQGDPIVATADGQVVSVEFDPESFGNNVIIRHKHGFYTRYAHMLSFRVKVGQQVKQGQVIGYIGNTGLTTGPHLHYEVHIGSDVVDPYKYITMRSNIAKR
jgi:murein DD-endopeptidase MepM/ murein hydrolase activator NlpD